MKLEQLKHLVTIVEYGSLRASARRPEIPQPAMTRSGGRWRKSSGRRCFYARPAAWLTPLGQCFHFLAGAIVNEASRAIGELSQGQGDDEGAVSVALSIVPLVGMLPWALSAFCHLHPKIRLNLTERLIPDVESALRQGGIDFYLGAAPRQAPAAGLLVLALFENTRTVICRKVHPLAAARSRKPLADAAWATTAVDHNAEADISNLFGSHGLPAPRVTLRSHSATAIMVALAYSDLLATLPVQWKFPLTRDTLQAIRVKELPPAPDIVMIRRPDLPLTPATEFRSEVLRRSQPSTRSRKK